MRPRYSPRDGRGIATIADLRGRREAATPERPVAPLVAPVMPVTCPVAPAWRDEAPHPGIRDQAASRGTAASRYPLRARLRAERELWAQARSLADLGALTALWLEGAIWHQPGYCDPEPGEAPGPDPETVPLVPVLAECCRSGFVTTCSQPGSPPEPGWDGRIWEQRAVAEGFCDRAAMLRIRRIARESGLIFIAHDPASRPRWRVAYRRHMTVTRVDGQHYTGFGAQLSRSHLRDTYLGYGECHRDAVRAVLAAWQVSVIDPEWGRDDVLWPALAPFAGWSQ